MDELTGLPLAFGKKAAPKKQVDPQRLHSTKRASPPLAVPVSVSRRPLNLLQSAADVQLLQPQHEQVGTGSVDSTTAASAAEESAAQGTPVQARNGADDAGSGDSALPITHEVVMKDHTKVGDARILARARAESR